MAENSVANGASLLVCARIPVRSITVEQGKKAPVTFEATDNDSIDMIKIEILLDRNSRVAHKVTRSWSQICRASYLASGALPHQCQVGPSRRQDEAGLVREISRSVPRCRQLVGIVPNYTRAIVDQRELGIAEWL